MKKDLKCDSCGSEIKRRERFCLKAELYAAPVVELEQDDISGNLREELERICSKAKEMDAKKLEEDVYICYHLTLCKNCRDKFNQRIKCKEFI